MAAFFTRKLLQWYDLHGRKNLPWQQQGAYAVWVSEMMLQQTQVKTVIPYYQTFIQRFPDVLTLAQAARDEVLYHWAGLGYYRRAVHLHQAAQIVVRDHAGVLPDSREDLIALPGIGATTAAAILAQAFHQPVAILDTHVRRILTRFHALQGDKTSGVPQKRLQHYADQHISRDRPAAYTQAIMDLGATVCTRSQPNCSACPVASDCRALALGLEDQLPHFSYSRPWRHGYCL